MNPMTREEWAIRLAEIETRCNRATPRPWKVCTAKDLFDNWPVCPSIGSDDDGNEWAVSTDCVHASEMVSGGAKEDAEFIASARQDVPDMIGYIRYLHAEIDRLKTGTTITKSRTREEWEKRLNDYAQKVSESYDEIGFSSHRRLIAKAKDDLAKILDDIMALQDKVNKETKV